MLFRKCTPYRRLLLSAALLLIVCGCGRGNAPEEPAAAVLETPAAAPQVVSLSVLETPAPTPPPTPVPTPTPTPAPTLAIPDAWYQARCDNIAAMLVRHGGCTAEQAEARVLSGMQLDPEKPMVALTFDDGPTRGVTDHVLDVLEKYGARATFFIIGTRIEGCEDLLCRMAAMGCELGSHTWGHGDLTVLSDREGRTSVQKSIDAIREACGYEVRFLRPPKGNVNAGVKKLALDMNLALIFWNHSTHDFRLDSAKKVERNVFHDVETDKEIAEGDIVLLHDLRKPTNEAIENIVRRLTEEGYQLVTVQELLYSSPLGFAAGESYSSQTEH